MDQLIELKDYYQGKLDAIRAEIELGSHDDVTRYKLHTIAVCYREFICNLDIKINGLLEVS